MQRVAGLVRRCRGDVHAAKHSDFAAGGGTAAARILKSVALRLKESRSHGSKSGFRRRNAVRQLVPEVGHVAGARAAPGAGRPAAADARAGPAGAQGDGRGLRLRPFLRRDRRALRAGRDRRHGCGPGPRRARAGGGVAMRERGAAAGRQRGAHGGSARWRIRPAAVPPDVPPHRGAGGRDGRVLPCAQARWHAAVRGVDAALHPFAADPPAVPPSDGRAAHGRRVHRHGACRGVRRAGRTHFDALSLVEPARPGLPGVDRPARAARARGNAGQPRRHEAPGGLSTAAGMPLPRRGCHRGCGEGRRSAWPLNRSAAPVAAQDEARVGSAEAEAVGHDGVHRAVCALHEQRETFRVGVGGVDVGVAGQEAALHHQQAVDGLLRCGGGDGMARQALGGGERRYIRAEHVAQGEEFGDVSKARRCAVRVHVIDGDAARLLPCEPQGAGATRLVGRDHVQAVRAGAVAHQFGMDARAAPAGMLQLFQHEDAGAAGDDEAVPVLVIGARCRRVVARRCERAHGIEEGRAGPADFLRTACDHAVLLAPLDQFGRMADAVGRTGAGRGQRVTGALDAERGGEVGRGGAAHDARRGVGQNLGGTFGAHHVHGCGMLRQRAHAGAHDQPRAGVRHVLRAERGVLDRLACSVVGIPGGVAHEAAQLAVDRRRGGEIGDARHLAPEAQLGVFRHVPHAGAPAMQRPGDGGQVVAQAGDDAHAGHGDAAQGARGRCGVRGLHVRAGRF